MEIIKFYGVFFEGDKKMWVRLTGVSDEHPDGTGWVLVDKFDRFCMLEEDQATGFLMKPGIDERYTKKSVRDLLALRILS